MGLAYPLSRDVDKYLVRGRVKSDVVGLHYLLLERRHYRK
jgi:hypothetical protein